ncbi:MAG: ABC transporter substrate-binding protein [Nitrososphaerota archaeon]|nr:ABC transporter substrate-binding protein [Nitrososphaerota archaeon]
MVIRRLEHFGVKSAVSRITAVIMIVAILIIAAVGGYGVLMLSQHSSPANVNLILDFTPTSYQSIFYYGLDHGIYRQNGIALTITSGSGSANAIAAVANGKADFGFADTGTLAVAAATSNVSNVRIVAMVLQNSFYTVIYNKANISSPTDLNGKTMGSFQGNGAQKLFTVFGKLNGVNVSSIKTTYTTPAQFNELVALGKVDFIVTGVDNNYTLRPVALQSNIHLGTFFYADYGVNIYGTAIIASTSMIDNHPDLVKKFVQASMQSLLASVQHPSEAISAMVSHNPQLNSTRALGGFEEIIKNCLPQNINSTSNALTLGWIDPQEMVNTVSVVTQGYSISNPPSASSLYTDQFVQSP